jgi:PHP family Zn ribbon phosphoesterase
MPTPYAGTASVLIRISCGIIRAVSAVAEGSRGGRVTCANPACGAEVAAGRARCPRCGSSLTKAPGAQRLEPIEKALAEHRARFARVAREAELVAGSTRQEIEARRESSRRELDTRLKKVMAESTRSARSEFDRAVSRIAKLAAGESGPRVGRLELRAPGGGQKTEVPVLLP